MPSVPMDLCEGLCPAVVGGEVTEGQPGVGGDRRSVQVGRGHGGVVHKMANLRNH